MGINKNYLKATVGLTLAVSSVPIFAPIYTEAATFSDVPQSAYYSDAVHVLAERGIINGYEDASFKPDVVATRGQTAKILAGILGLDTINVVDPGFTDVLPDNPFYGAIAALVQAGIINGYEDHTFRMNEPLQRNHLAKILVKAFDLKSSEGATMPLTDAHKAYKDYILALYTNGITTGKTDTLFDGESYVTRGQLAAFVVRTEEVVQAANDKEQPDVVPIPPVEPIPTPNPSLTFTLSIEGMSDLFSTVTEYELKTSSVIGTLYLEGDVVKITFVSEEAIPKESFKTKINGVEYEFKFNKNENNWGAKKVKEAISTVPDSTLPPEPEPTPPTTPKPPSTVSVTGITLDATTATINQGDTAQLTASILPTNATNKNVTWTSSDENVVTVDSQGKVTAIGAGNATITAATVDGSKTATATYTVTQKVLSVTAPTVSSKEYDGTTEAKVTIGTVTGIAPGDDVIVNVLGTFDTAEVGTGKTVEVTYSLSGTDASNYAAPTNTVVTTGEITARAVTASSDGITTATGTTTITLGQVIPGLTASDIVVKKDGTALPSTAYSLGALIGTTVDITFDTTAGLANGQIITVEMIKAGYAINGGSAIDIANTILAPPALTYSAIIGTQGQAISGVAPANANTTVVTGYSIEPSSTLPAGLVLNPTTGEITGIPTVLTSGAETVTIVASYNDNGATKTVDVTVSITVLLPAPAPALTVVGSNNGIVAYFSPVEFTFTDDPQWRAAITSVVVLDSNGILLKDWISTAQINYENIKLAPYLVVHGANGLITYTIKATGYADTSVTVTVQ